jgi:hypothetical protein
VIQHVILDMTCDFHVNMGVDGYPIDSVGDMVQAMSTRATSLIGVWTNDLVKLNATFIPNFIWTLTDIFDSFDK